MTAIATESVEEVSREIASLGDITPGTARYCQRVHRITDDAAAKAKIVRGDRICNDIALGPVQEA